MRQRRNILTGVLSLLAACGQKLTETSVELDITRLPTLFDALRAQIPQGFTDEQKVAIGKDFRALPMNGTKEYLYPAAHEGTTGTLRVTIRKEDVDAVEIRFYAPPEITTAIERTIRKTPLDVAP